jgi:hypothetical protein
METSGILQLVSSCSVIWYQIMKSVWSRFYWIKTNIQTNKLRGLSPRANYIDRATAVCRRSWCQLLQIEGVRVVSATDTPGRILAFLGGSLYYFFQLVRHLYSRGWMDPFPDPLLLRKSGSAGNRTRDLWICIQEQRQSGFTESLFHNASLQIF